MSKVHGARFAQIPEWVLDAAISDRAVRAYCVLARYANSDSRAHPGRKKMSDRMDCSTDSLDRALKELVAIGALEIRPRFRENGDRTSNDYHLLDQPHQSGEVGAPVRPPPSAPQRPALRTAAAGEEREPENESQIEELPAATAPERPSKQRWSSEADAIAKAFWSSAPTKPVCGFHALRLRIQEALDAGHPAADVAGVLPRMPAFSRNAFDFALRGKAKPRTADRAMTEDPHYWDDPPGSEQS